MSNDEVAENVPKFEYLIEEMEQDKEPGTSMSGPSCITTEKTEQDKEPGTSTSGPSCKKVSLS